MVTYSFHEFLLFAKESLYIFFCYQKLFLGLVWCWQCPKTLVSLVAAVAGSSVFLQEAAHLSHIILVCFCRNLPKTLILLTGREKYSCTLNVGVSSFSKQIKKKNYDQFKHKRLMVLWRSFRVFCIPLISLYRFLLENYHDSISFILCYFLLQVVLRRIQNRVVSVARLSLSLLRNRNPKFYARQGV